jgi:hypothetical protein
MAEHPEHSTPMSSGVVHQTAITSEPETIGVGAGPHDGITDPFALRGKGARGTIPASQYQTSRDSQASFVSATTRTSSIAESVFSTSGLRCMSTYSSRLSSARQDSADSEPVSAISPWETDRYKSGFDPGHRYFCTFCDNSFESKAVWRAHERDFHGESNGYTCKDCSASYPALASLSSHLRVAHGSERFASAMDPGQPLAERRVWGCGFCSTLIYSQADYLGHVEAHFDEGKEKVHWHQQSVVKALLHQPMLRGAWESAVSRQQATQGAKLRFCWDEQMASTLQAMLECFVANQDSPQALAEFALFHADAKAETNVAGKYGTNGLTSRISQPEPPSLYGARAKVPSASPTPLMSGRMSPRRHPISPSASGPQLDEFLGDFNPPMPPAPRAPFSSQAARKAMQLDDHALRILAKIDEGNSPPILQCSKLQNPIDANNVHNTAKPSLHRVESEWHLDASVTGRKPATDSGIPRPRTSLATRPVSSARRLMEDETVEFVQSPVSHLPRSPLGAHAACEQWLMVAKPSSLPSPRPLSGSSLVSSHAAGKSPVNSVSDGASDDSLSEPDSWLELNDKSDATRQWTRTFHHTVDGVLDGIWIRYNREWDTLITKCTGEQNGLPSQYAQPGLAPCSTMSHLAPSYGSRPNHSRQPSDDKDDDDDDVDRHRPSSSQSKRSSTSPKRYACPFRKHDPLKYNLQDHEICTVRSWDSVSRMKYVVLACPLSQVLTVPTREHLYRKHCKVHCVRCKQTFRKPAELELHELAAEGCQVREVRYPPADITAQQERHLKSKRYATRYQTEEEKWREVYRLLFPGEPVPSPCECAEAVPRSP